MVILLRKNHNCINGAGVIDEGPTHDRADVNSEHCKIIIQQSGTTNTEQKLRLGGLNVGTMRGCAGEVKTLTSRKVDMCCVQEIRWRIALARLITETNSDYTVVLGYWLLGSGLIRSLM